jgi:hypothetical protein
VGTDFVVTPSDVYGQARPAVAADPSNGDFLVTWEAHFDNVIKILARRFVRDGTAFDTAFVVNTDTLVGTDTLVREESPVATPEPDGVFLIVWTSPTDGTSLGVFGQRFASDGAPIGTEFRAPSYGVGGQYDASAAPTGGGRSFVTWTDQSGRDGDGFGVFGRVLPDPPSPTGNTTTPTVTATPAASVTPAPSACVGDCNGNHVVEINELITAVGIALDNSVLALCHASDADENGTVTVNDLVQAVNNALHGCGG